MLSSLARKSGVISLISRPPSSQRILAAIQSRNSSNTSPTDEQLIAAAKQKTGEPGEDWDKANNIFYGPERDKKNFPHPVLPEHAGKVRMGFIPDEWFQFFYPKTGVTGPYLFTTGLVAYLFSKEIWVVDHSFSEVIGFYIAVWILVKKLGPMFGKFLDDAVEKSDERNFKTPLKESKAAFTEVIGDIEHQIWQEEGKKHVAVAKKENVEFQLESLYRLRLQNVYNKVKSRLDYQLEMQTSKRSFEQDHMVNWIVKNVVKGITPQQEKESLSKCIGDLKQLARV